MLNPKIHVPLYHHFSDIKVNEEIPSNLPEMQIISGGVATFLCGAFICLKKDHP